MPTHPPRFTIGQPGSPDGPPAPEEKGFWYYVGVFLAGVTLTGLALFVVLLFAWVFAWLVTNFPG